MGDILIVLLFLAFIFGIYSIVLHDKRIKKDSNGLNYYNSFHLICPVCKCNNRYSKESACKSIVNFTSDEIRNKKIKCSGCSVDLAGLYFSQDFVRNAITESERLKGSKELTMQYLEELGKLKQVTYALGENYVQEDVQAMHSDIKNRA